MDTQKFCSLMHLSICLCIVISRNANSIEDKTPFIPRAKSISAKRRGQFPMNFNRNSIFRAVSKGPCRSLALC